MPVGKLARRNRNEVALINFKTRSMIVIIISIDNMVAVASSFCSKPTMQEARDFQCNTPVLVCNEMTTKMSSPPPALVGGRSRQEMHCSNGYSRLISSQFSNLCFQHIAEAQYLIHCNAKTQCYTIPRTS